MRTEAGLREITAPIEITIEGDRLRFTLVSGDCVRTYSVSFNKARTSIRKAVKLLDAHERREVVSAIGKRKAGAPPAHS